MFYFWSTLSRKWQQIPVNVVVYENRIICFVLITNHEKKWLKKLYESLRLILYSENFCSSHSFNKILYVIVSGKLWVRIKMYQTAPTFIESNNACNYRLIFLQLYRDSVSQVSNYAVCDASTAPKCPQE